VPNLAPPFPETALVRAVTHSEVFPDEEVCGVFVRELECLDGNRVDYIEFDSKAIDRKHSFAIDRAEYDRLEEKYEVLAVFHSHWADFSDAELSFEDIKQSKWNNTPYLLYHVIDKTWDYFDPQDLNPFPLLPRPSNPKSLEHYLGLPWVWNRADCYTLLRNYYLGRLDIELPDFPRAPTPEQQLDGNWDTFIETMPKIGFVSVEQNCPLKENDLLLIKMFGSEAHHCGIITDAKKPEFIHHVSPTRTSEVKVYGGYWLESTVQRLRWKEFL